MTSFQERCNQNARPASAATKASDGTASSRPATPLDQQFQDLRQIVKEPGPVVEQEVRKGLDPPAKGNLLVGQPVQELPHGAIPPRPGCGTGRNWF